MTDYEIQVDGSVGPVTRSSLSEFAEVRVPAMTVISGTAATPDEMLKVFDLLAGAMLTVSDIRISRAAEH